MLSEGARGSRDNVSGLPIRLNKGIMGRGSTNLLSRGCRHAMDVAPQDAAAPLDHCVAEVDEGASGLGANVAPVFVEVFGAGGEELEAAVDVEEHGHGADVGVAG